MKPCYIIGEIGVNHNGDEKLAYKLIDVAKKCGADAVKFQTFNVQALASKSAKKAEYQLDQAGDNSSQYDMLKSLELDAHSYLRLKEYSDKIGIDFISTPFDIDSVDLLEKIGVSIYKVGSGDLTNFQLLKHIAKKGKKIILSTGMSTLEEIQNAVRFINDQGNVNLTILHCVSAYPTPLEEVNMKCLNTIHQMTGLPVGFSDHTLGYHAAIVAVSLGASVIEKHFTLDCGMKGPDHKASLDPEQFYEYVKVIRLTQRMLGDGNKICTFSENKNKDLVRRCVAFKKHINKGKMIKEEDLIALRPFSEEYVPAEKFFDLIGKIADSDYDEFQFVPQRLL